MRNLIVLSFILSGPAFAQNFLKEGSPMGFAMPYSKGAADHEVVGNPNNGGEVVIDASAFGDLAGKVCGWLLSGGPEVKFQNAGTTIDHHMVFGHLLRNRLSLIPEFETAGRPDQFGLAKINIAPHNSLEVYSSKLHPDVWRLDKKMSDFKLPNSHFEPKGKILAMLPQFFAALAVIEGYKSDPSRYMQIYGKLTGKGEAFEIESLSTRMELAGSVTTNDLVLIQGEFSKTAKGFQVISKSGKSYDVKLESNLPAALQMDKMLLSRLNRKQVFVQGTEDRVGVLSVLPGEETFVREVRD